MERRLQGRLPLPGGPHPLAIAAGVVRAGPIRAPAGGEATLEAAIDVRQAMLTARAQLSARETPQGWSGPPPAAEIVLRGPWTSPARTIDVGPLANGLTGIAIQREQERIEILEQDQRERSFFNRRLRAAEEQRRAEEEERKRQEAVRKAEEEARLRAEEEERRRQEDERRRAEAERQSREVQRRIDEEVARRQACSSASRKSCAPPRPELHARAAAGGPLTGSLSASAPPRAHARGIAEERFCIVRPWSISAMSAAALIPRAAASRFSSSQKAAPARCWCDALRS